MAGRFSIMAVLVVMGAAVAVASNRVSLTEFTDESGKTSYYVVDREALQKCPAWDLQSEPPLPITQAIAKAKEWLKKKYPSFSFGETTGISLSRVWEPGSRWYYNVNIDGRATVNGLEATRNFAVVLLMDGSVVEPSDKKGN